MNDDTDDALSKVPEVTLWFWIIKIAATTLGETGGDAVTMSMGLGYLVGTAIFAAVFLIAVATQIAARRFHAFLYWAVIVATTTAGTTLADLLDRSLGIGYFGGSALLLFLLLATLFVWRRSLGTVSVASVTTRDAEAFYWATIMFSQTLGTALGDWLADPKTGLGLGYEGGAIVFAIGLAVVAVAWYRTSISRAALFWAAFILTRPLGATVGDLLDKPHESGGLASAATSPRRCWRFSSSPASPCCPSAPNGRPRGRRPDQRADGAARATGHSNCCGQRPRRSPMSTNKTAKGGAEPGTSIGNQGSGGGPAQGGPTEKTNQATGQQRSKERGSHTQSKKQPGKRPHQGGSSA